MLNFDKNGLLTPYEAITCDWSLFEKTFTFDMPQAGRKLLFSGLGQFFEAYFNLTKEASIKVWINGSFTTNKPNPADIDLVYFVSDEVARKFETEISRQFSYPESLQLYGVDAYLVRVFDENHTNFFRTKTDTLYWLHRFTKTRLNRRGVSFKKGFLEIQLTQHEIRKS